MPGALVPERHNTLDGKGWSPMLSRLLGVFALQYPVGQVWLCIITRSYHFNTTWVDHDDDYFYIICGQLQPVFGPRFATFSTICLINFSWAFEAGYALSSATADRGGKGRKGTCWMDPWHH